MRENTDQENSEYGHFSLIVTLVNNYIYSYIVAIIVFAL